MANKIYKTQFKNGYHYLVGYVPYTVNGIKKHKEVTYRVANPAKISSAEKKAFDAKFEQTKTEIEKQSNNKDLFNTIFERHYKIFVKPELKESSRVSYEKRFQNVIKPHFEDKKLQDIDSFFLQQYFNELLYIKNLSNGYVRHIYFAIKKVLHHLHMDDKILKNPMLLVNLPKSEQVLPTAPTYEQMQLIKKYINASDINKSFKLAMNIIINEGLRVSECCGLCLDEIDLQMGVVHITHTVTDNKGKILLSDETKSYNSDRHITFSDETMKLINDFINQNTLKHYKENNKTYLIQHDDGTPINSKYVANCYFKLVSAMIKKEILPKDTRTGIHKTRTTLSTHWKQIGIDAAIISRHLGHDETMNKKRYTGKLIIKLH